MSNPKRGSALLIVLGFLSFMVVSAVAFSIYMRSERQPSSALRRVVTSRHLARAALARAMGEIDDAVRYEAFPGCLSGTTKAPQRSGSANGQSGPTCQRAAWLGRIFMPLCPDDDLGNVNSADRYIIPDERLGESVSTLTLEGLGYIPPPLVNDARYNSRRSWSSVWKYFAFDAGRYAYTALNVSDYFDVNRLQAWTNRNSGANGRVTLSYLFGLKDGQMTQKATEMKSFDDFLRVNRGGELGELPFVSMMDYTLALGRNSLQSISPLFYEWLDTGNRSTFYNTVASDRQGALDNDQMLKAIRQPFVTDSWFPVTNSAANTVLDLSSSECQPLDGFPLQNPTWANLMSRNKFWNKFTEEMPPTLTALLYDYLDADDIPTSLVMPCTEFMPMIAEFDVSGQPTFTLRKTSSDITDQNGNVTGQETSYTVDIAVPNLMVNVMPVFPFKHGLDRMENNSFKIQAIARLFLADSGTINRSSTGFGKIDWNTYKGKSAEAAFDGNSSIVLVSAPVSFSIPKVEKEEDAEIEGVAVPLPNFSETRGLFKVITQDGQTTYDAANGGSQISILDSGYNEIAAPADIAGSGVSVVPQVAITLRVMASSGKTVDLVPAMGEDDVALGGSVQIDSSIINNICGDKTPLMRVQTKFSGQGNVNGAFSLNASSLGTLMAAVNELDMNADDFTQGVNGYFCGDPRFNWAPEDWVNKQAGNNAFSDWLQNVAGAFLGSSAFHDADIFMNVSNAGYLQSIGEFMFLPRISDVRYKTHDPALGFIGDHPATLDGAIRTSAGDLANAKCMWRCYKPMELVDTSDRPNADNLYQLGVVNGQGGFRINPYTDDATVFLGAIANTPVDWWAAATNVDTQSSSKDRNDLRFDESIKLSYGPDSDTDQWTWDQVKEVSDKLHERFLKALADNSMSVGKTPADWLSVYDSTWSHFWTGASDPLGLSSASDNEDQLFGVSLSGSTLYDADRKFLYDYWRDCFACRQQLFLIFVRAESTALGGSGDGGTPGQLGVRAVALVWRDPEAPSNGRDGVASQDDDANKPENASEDTNPRPSHRMRVLFYHQFD